MAFSSTFKPKKTKKMICFTGILEGFRTYLPQISWAYYTATSVFMPKLPNSTLTSLRVGSIYTLVLKQCLMC